jgi:hypothetical protein
MAAKLENVSLSRLMMLKRLNVIIAHSKTNKLAFHKKEKGVSCYEDYTHPLKGVIVVGMEAFPSGVGVIVVGMEAFPSGVGVIVVRMEAFSSGVGVIVVGIGFF